MAATCDSYWRPTPRVSPSLTFRRLSTTEAITASNIQCGVGDAIRATIPRRVPAEVDALSLVEYDNVSLSRRLMHNLVWWPVTRP